MLNLYTLIDIEFYKNKHSSITWITFLAFAIAPIMGGIFVLLVRNPELISKVGALQAKAAMLDFSDDWSSYFSLLTQAVGVGGILLFGFVASWIFGREFPEGTSKDLLALPVSRKAIIDAKFATYVLWCLALSMSNILIGLIIGTVLDLKEWAQIEIERTMMTYFVTSALTILAGVPVALLALVGRGYLSPLGFVAFTLVFAQIIAATGFGSYFPWSVPGLYSGAAGEYRSQLNVLSYSLLAVVALAGYVGARSWFQSADQSR
jgi:ABC-type transport system involved in multi-copper enzyme maturation permease subunit